VKKWLFVLLGLFLAAMAVTAAVSGGVFGYLFAVGFALWSWRCFRAAGRHAPERPGTASGRPWER
jgi:hypothetical protein